MSGSSVGIDLVEVKKVARLVDRWGDRFLHRVFTAEEIAYCMQKSDPNPSLAARFAAKEAFIKALSGIGGERVRYRDVEVRRGKTGPPGLRLSVQHGCLEGKALSVTLTHTQDHAAACVLISDEN